MARALSFRNLIGGTRCYGGMRNRGWNRQQRCHVDTVNGWRWNPNGFVNCLDACRTALEPP